MASRPLPKIVGMWVNEKKCLKFDLAGFIEECRKLNMEVVMLDLSKPISKRLPVDVIIHKISALYAQSLDGNLQALEYAENFENFIEDNPHIPIMDPLPGVQTLLHRPATYALLDATFQKDADGVLFNPPFVELPGNVSLKEKQERVRAANLTFPIVCKPVFGCGGTEAHEMAVVLSINRLDEWKGPCVAQSFIQHRAVLYKIFVLGDIWHLVLRPSLKNFTEKDAPTIHFNSAHVSKADSCSPLTFLDHTEIEPIPIPDYNILNRIVERIQSSLKMDLLGIDIVIERKTLRYAVIDINPFPSYADVPNFIPGLAFCLHKKMEKHKKQPHPFYSSRVRDMLIPLKTGANGELVATRTRNSAHLNIPEILRTRGHISSVREINFDGTNVLESDDQRDSKYLSMKELCSAIGKTSVCNEQYTADKS